MPVWKGLSKAHEVDLGDWDQMIDTNITGLVHVTRHILPGMVDRNRGMIINIGQLPANGPTQAVTSTVALKLLYANLVSTYELI
ncbi:hypothetical protein OURE66S_02776 [Oligella ureolytica]